MPRALTLLLFGLVAAVPVDRAIAQAKPAAAPPTAAQKIANAISAAPSSISDKAAVMDWPATEGGSMAALRPGTNGWTCLPDFPATDGNDPACMDDQWMSFMGAVLTKTPPHVTRAGVGYMIAPGGGYGSNTDPWAAKATPDNEWGFDPPHLMFLVPDPHGLDGLPTKRQSGGPWVMWAGTPYAHIMAPLASPK